MMTRTWLVDMPGVVVTAPELVACIVMAFQSDRLLLYRTTCVMQYDSESSLRSYSKTH